MRLLPVAAWSASLRTRFTSRRILRRLPGHPLIQRVGQHRDDELNGNREHHVGADLPRRRGWCSLLRYAEACDNRAVTGFRTPRVHVGYRKHSRLATQQVRRADPLGVDCTATVDESGHAMYRMKNDTVRPIDHADAAALRSAFGLKEE